MPEPLDRFLSLHDEVREKFPKLIKDARRLAESTWDPKTKCPEEMWAFSGTSRCLQMSTSPPA